MKRISKEYDERLNELLDTAQQLFFEKGYEKTSVNHIIDKVGIAKGTFYHYFKTKSELLDKLVERFAEELLGKMRKLVKRTDLDAVQKLNGMFALGRSIKAKNVKLMKLLLQSLYNEDNLVLRHRIIKSRMVLTMPEFKKILEQGKQEGLFQMSGDPGEIAELIYFLGININEIAGEMILTLNEQPGNIDIIERKINAYEAAVERILGIAEGSIKVVDRDFIHLFVMDKDDKK
jgi:AcrR family transcriptional regulator